MATPVHSVHVSIVSHAQDKMTDGLLKCLLQNESASIATYISVTLNINLSIDQSQYVARHKAGNVRWIENSRPKGFGANHNAAMLGQATPIDCDLLLILNPDVVMHSKDIEIMANSFDSPEIALVYPTQSLHSGELLDFERSLTTPWQIMKRRFKYTSRKSENTDWVSGSCMMFRTDVFRALQGFDERYFMYCEDVDICLRLQLAGFKMKRASCTVIHNTQRATLKSWRHFTWHITSLFKLWCSRTYWKYLQKNA
jgi:N-acetylglucosaminyl-diphospho-decaprenol L-rhamnosyltransferase